MGTHLAPLARDSFPLTEVAYDHCDLSSEVGARPFPLSWAGSATLSSSSGLPAESDDGKNSHHCGALSQEGTPFLAKTPLLHEPVLLLLLSDLLCCPRMLPFSRLLLQPSHLGGHTGFLLIPQSGLFSLTFLLFGCRNLGI